MTSSRGVSGPGEPGKVPTRVEEQQNRRVQKVEKVRAVDEAENERTRKKFQTYMSDEDEASEQTRQPSPFETSFYAPEPPMIQSSPSLEEDLNEDVVASPSYSPPPDVNIAPVPEDNESPPLPRSQDFWHHVDSPPTQPAKGPQYLEKHETQTKKAKEKERIEQTQKEILVTAPKKEEKDSIFGPPGKIVPEKKEKIAAKEKPIHKKDETALPSSVVQSEVPKKMEKESTIRDNKEKEERLLPSIHTDAQGQTEKHFHDDKEESGNRSGKPIEIEAPTTTTIPANIIPLAQAATEQVSSYLSPQTSLLFTQMVGTIYVMSATPGVSKTDIVLNSPSFANSKFFGTTITIEKYATAPDSFNIRITGSNEAVKTFNDNLTNLYSAFQNGNFNFRIGRLSAEYSIERPVFRRKDQGDGRSDTGGGDFSDRRGK